MRKEKGTLKQRVKRALAQHLVEIGYNDSFVKTILDNIPIKPASSFEIKANNLIIHYPSGKQCVVDIESRVQNALAWRQAMDLALYAPTDPYEEAKKWLE